MSIGEQTYYDQEGLWKAERYLADTTELLRLNTTIDTIPSDVESLLDVGAGNGAFLRLLEERRSSLSCAGIERSQIAINSSVCTIKIVRGSIDSLPFDNRCFDVVSALEVIEHLPFSVYETSLQEIARVSRKYILISVPYREQLRLVICPYCSSGFHPYNHLRRFDEKRLESLFVSHEAISLRMVKARKPLSLPSPLHLFRRLSGRVSSLPPLAVCPVCSYSEIAASKGKHDRVSNGRKALDKIKSLIPAINQVIWIIALYRRIQQE
jgi:SAM-dependent methyltransferase